ncbi:SLOG family protein [Peribacillus deserti]|uniref:SLOG family protein n=1 Tax=Peribacillus deserti TaxID=673318 RepID=UPI00195D3532
MKNIFITGYKGFELGIFKREHQGVAYIKKAIANHLISLIEDGLEWVLISGQLGTELWAAEAVYELQNEYPELKIAVLTPYLEQEANWNENNKEFYESILAQADYVDSISKKPYESPLQLKTKNHFCMKKSDALLIFYDEEREGSPKFMYQDARLYAESHPYPIYQITFDDLQQIAEEEQWE